MYEYIVLIFITGILLQSAYGEPCTTDNGIIFGRTTHDINLLFITAVPTTIGLSYLSAFRNNTELLKVLFINGVFNSVPTNKVNTTGSLENGDLSFTIYHLSPEDEGIYKLIETTFGKCACLQFTTLYILGIPTTPIIKGNSVNEGDTATLSCTSTSTTVPSTHLLKLRYSWKVNDTNDPTDSRYKYSTDGKHLNVTDITKRDTSLTFRCIATEMVTGGMTSNESDIYKIAVLYGPDSISFGYPNDEFEQVENTTIRPFNCTASCYPACTYTWDKIGYSEHISVDGILNLGYLQRSMAGLYRCTATNPGRARGSGSTATKDLTLHIIYGPNNIEFEPPNVEHKQVVNTTIQPIKCTASCYPECTYIWEKTDSSRRIGVDGVLNLGYIQRSMAGVYGCTTFNPRRGSNITATKNLTLNVIYGPDSVNVSDGHTLIVTEGTQHVNITCTSNCYPSCISFWISTTVGSADIYGDVLSLGQVTRNQTGKYKCTTSNTAPEYQRTVDATLDITVNYVPEINVLLFRNHELIENSNAELKCNATGVPSSYNYVDLTQTWGSATIPNPRPPISTTPLHSSLRFVALRFEDTGTYTCIVNNGVRDAEGILNQISTIEVLVKVSPKITLRELTFAGALSGFVRINVPFYSFPPADSISFTRQDGIRIQTNNRTTVSHEISPVMTKFYGADVILNGSVAFLQITDIQETDFTNYIFEATNIIGRNWIIISLIPQSESTSHPPHIGPNTGPNTEPVIGGVLGSVTVLAVGVVVVIFLNRRRNRKLRCKKKSANENDQTAPVGPYTSMNYSTDNESEYLEINREQGQPQAENTNVYVNLELSVQ